LSKLLFGGGGGGGGTTNETSTSKGTKGGNGGGIIYIGASSIIFGDSGRYLQTEKHLKYLHLEVEKEEQELADLLS
jgi:uncharacterized spore protein YtfJ